ncbi:hypothetical protein EVAR_44783_1 [Eumeta japonica]|uniref:Uncharacterized protein n=1 Tax=Eumeta variegata TaxID=151549 RepID=A0A4C1YAB5_EUMVA|nr:hypothetical protein EVAR_44783_1 [Eumeta japonica]
MRRDNDDSSLKKISCSDQRSPRRLWTVSPLSSRPLTHVCVSPISIAILGSKCHSDSDSPPLINTHNHMGIAEGSDPLDEAPILPEQCCNTRIEPSRCSDPPF